MEQNVIIAQKVFSERKAQEVWQVAIQVPSGKMFSRIDCTEPIKAIRCMYMLKARHGIQINPQSMEVVLFEHRILKAKAEAERIKSENMALQQLAEEHLASEAEKKAQA